MTFHTEESPGRTAKVLEYSLAGNSRAAKDSLQVQQELLGMHKMQVSLCGSINGSSHKTGNSFAGALLWFVVVLVTFPSHGRGRVNI